MLKAWIVPRRLQVQLPREKYIANNLSAVVSLENVTVSDPNGM